jgi:ERF superfamily
MGAALTYARRYALFTLVGIAGEDDLDAPDLNTPTVPTAGADNLRRKRLGRLNGGQQHFDPQFPLSRSAKGASVHSKPILEPEASIALREQLVAELKEINSAEEAAIWAHRDALDCARATASGPSEEWATSAEVSIIIVASRDRHTAERSSAFAPLFGGLMATSGMSRLDRH